MAKAGFARAKRVTDPLDDKARARIVEPAYVSSGSSHGGENADQGDDSSCLSDLIHGFLEYDAVEGDPPDYDSCSERDSSVVDSDDLLEDFLDLTVANDGDSFRNMLSVDVSKAIAVFLRVKLNKTVFRRRVMGFLRELGYNAAICKTKWPSYGGVTGGNHEFIDVVRSDSARSRYHRYIVDLGFRGEFEIARPTHQYERLLQALPEVFVGTGVELKHMATVMSDAAARSLKSRGLDLPPWRKNRHMQNKWFGPYRRTTNAIPENSPSLLIPTSQSFEVKCRSVGFDTVNARLSLPATTRTR
ncbi:hypothetical protein NMG60_11014298 [Bertholletia excelsa]